MTPKALSREDLLKENKYLKEKIKWLEKEIFWNRVGMTIATIILGVIALITK